MVKLFEKHTTEEHASAIAHYLPGGCLFEAARKNDSLYRMLLRGLGEIGKEVEDFLQLFADNIDPCNTEAFLSEWEATVGLPDECFTDVRDTLTDQERRDQICFKLSALGIVTEQDFIDLAAFFGVDIRIGHGIDHYAFTYTWPLVFFPDFRAARFTMIVFYAVEEIKTFTYTYPIPFGFEILPILQCLFRKLSPANVDILWWQDFQVDPSPIRQFNNGFSDGFN